MSQDRRQRRHAIRKEKRPAPPPGPSSANSACPCAPGYSCSAAFNHCRKLCDYTQGTPVALSSGQVVAGAVKNNAQCDSDPSGGNACTKVDECTGVCAFIDDGSL